jgi:hypothetical protein
MFELYILDVRLSIPGQDIGPDCSSWHIPRARGNTLHLIAVERIGAGAGVEHVGAVTQFYHQHGASGETHRIKVQYYESRTTEQTGAGNKV